MHTAAPPPLLQVWLGCELCVLSAVQAEVLLRWEPCARVRVFVSTAAACAAHQQTGIVSSRPTRPLSAGAAAQTTAQQPVPDASP